MALIFRILTELSDDSAPRQFKSTSWTIDATTLRDTPENEGFQVPTLSIVSLGVSLGGVTSKITNKTVIVVPDHGQYIGYTSISADIELDFSSAFISSDNNNAFPYSCSGEDNYGVNAISSLSQIQNCYYYINYYYPNSQAAPYIYGESNFELNSVLPISSREDMLPYNSYTPSPYSPVPSYSPVLIADATLYAPVHIFGEGKIHIDGYNPLGGETPPATVYDVDIEYKDVSFRINHANEIQNDSIELAAANGYSARGSTFSISETHFLLSVKKLSFLIRPRFNSETSLQYTPLAQFKCGTFFDMGDSPLYGCGFELVSSEPVQYKSFNTYIFFYSLGGAIKSAVLAPASHYQEHLLTGLVIPTIPIANPYIFDVYPDYSSAGEVANPKRFNPKYSSEYEPSNSHLRDFFMACTTLFNARDTMIALNAKMQELRTAPIDVSDLSSIDILLFEQSYYGYIYWDPPGHNLHFSPGSYEYTIEHHPDESDPYREFVVKATNLYSGYYYYIFTFAADGTFGYSFDFNQNRQYETLTPHYGQSYVWIYRDDHGHLVPYYPATGETLAAGGPFVFQSTIDYLSSLRRLFQLATTIKRRNEILGLYEDAIQIIKGILASASPNTPTSIYDNDVRLKDAIDDIRDWYDGTIPPYQYPHVSIPVAHNKYDIMELQKFKMVYISDRNAEYNDAVIVPIGDYDQERPAPTDVYPVFWRKQFSLFKDFSPYDILLFIVSYHRKTNQLIRNDTDKPVDPPQKHKHLLRNDKERFIQEYVDKPTKRFGVDSIFRKA